MRSAALALILIAVATACAPAASTRESSSLSSPSPSPETFVVPAVSPSPDIFVPEPETVPVDEPSQSATKYPEVAAQVRQVFERVYAARTLRPGGQFDVGALRGLVAGVYADYTLPLFDREVRDAQAGILQEVSFTNISVGLVSWLAEGAARPQDTVRPGTAYVVVSRTRHETRKDQAATSEPATFYFRARRGADGVSWVVDDFATGIPWVTPQQGRWLSQDVPIGDAQAADELKAFFTDFYAARSLSPGGVINLGHSSWLVAGSYAAYTIPLLERSQAEAKSGALKEIRYTDIDVRVERWDPKATQHGGLATVAVTRTAFVTRSTGADPPQRATYEFRVHRHDVGNWLAVDFFRPDLNRWVTDLAGATVIVPLQGHG